MIKNLDLHYKERTIAPKQQRSIENRYKESKQKFFKFCIELQILNSQYSQLLIMTERISQSPTRLPFNENDKSPEIIGLDDIVYEIQEDEPSKSDQLYIQEDNHESDQTSFVDAHAEKRDSSLTDNKKERFIKYLNHHHISQPAPKKKETNLEDQLSSILNVELNNKRSQEFILKFNKKPALAIEAFLQKINKEKQNESKENELKVVPTNHLSPYKSTLTKPNDTIKQKTLIEQNEERILARYLLSIEGLDKNVLGQYFGKNNEKVIKIFHQFCNSLDFKDMEYDLALRKLLSKFRLPGESQQIQRIIWEFSLSFYEQNKHSFDNADQLFPLAYSIIMLATDAHNPKQQKKMSIQQFVRNTQRPCPSIGKQYLEHIYGRITKDRLETENNVGQIIYARLRDMQTLPKIMDQLQNTKELMEGTVILKICRDNTKLPFTNPRQSKFVQRKLYLSTDQQKINWVSFPLKEGEQPRFIQVKDIIDLTLGIAPHLKKNNKVPKEFDSLCFTVTTTYRHLDLKAKNTKQRSQWLNYLRAVMIQRRQNRKIQLQQKQNSILCAKALEEAWNGEIFPNWDRYWDYTLKKPKKIGYFRRGIEALCGCFEKQSQNAENDIDGSLKLGMTIKNNLLQSLWRYGLPPSSRKTLWVEIIGNPLELNKIMIDDIKKRKIHSEKLRSFTKDTKKLEPESLTKTQKQKFWKNKKEDRFDEQIYEMTEFLITLRPDIPHVRDLLLMSNVFYHVIQMQENKLTEEGTAKQIENKSGESKKARQIRKLQKNQVQNTQLNLSNQQKIRISRSENYLEKKKQISPTSKSPKIKQSYQSSKLNQNSLICLANIIHKHHFLSFFRGQISQIEGRTKLFEFLIEKNAPSVLEHFSAIKLETRMYLVPWFLSVFSMSFSQEFLWRIWDNFLLEEQLYLFKVGIAIVKYYEPQLKMCTFSQGLELLKQPPEPSAALFFHILQSQINVTADNYHFYIEKRKHAMIKTKVQSIPLE